MQCGSYIISIYTSCVSVQNLTLFLFTVLFFFDASGPVCLCVCCRLRNPSKYSTVTKTASKQKRIVDLIYMRIICDFGLLGLILYVFGAQNIAIFLPFPRLYLFLLNHLLSAVSAKKLQKLS